MGFVLSSFCVNNVLADEHVSEEGATLPSHIAGTVVITRTVLDVQYWCCLASSSDHAY
jgi:hypothetical protein